MCIVCQAKSFLKPDYKLVFGDNVDADGVIAPTARGPGPEFLETSNPTATNSPSSNQNVNGVLSNTRFSSLNLTYLFPQLATDYETNYGDISATTSQAITSFAPITTAMQVAARYAFTLASQVSGLNITEATAGPTNFRLGLFTPNPDGTTGPQTAFAYLPTTSIVGGDSWYSNTASFTGPVRGNYAWVTMLHEIGHNLGLKHGHEFGGAGGVSIAPDRDSMEFSLMTYRGYIGADTGDGYRNERFGFAQTFMMYDIAALQHMYGADFTTNNTNSVYTFSEATGEMSINGIGQGAPGGNRVFLTIWDGGGTDTYDFSNYTGGQAIDLRAGGWSSMSLIQLANLGDGKYARGNVFNALQYQNDTRSLIENAIGGSQFDVMVGNQVSNVLEGRGGNDQINGGSGNDTLFGQDGDDFIEGDFSNIVLVAANPGVGFTGPSSQTFGPGGVPTSQSTALNISQNFSFASNANIANSTTDAHTSITAEGNGAAHWFRLEIGSADVVITLDIDATTGGLDSFVRLFYLQPGGGQPLPPGGLMKVAENDDSPTTFGGGGSTVGIDSFLTFRTLQPGTYFIVVGSFGAATDPENPDTLLSGRGYTLHVSVRGETPIVPTDGGTPGNDQLFGGEGNDTLLGGGGADVLDGGNGIDMASYANAGAGVYVGFGDTGNATGEAAGDTFISIENLGGSAFADVLSWDNNANSIFGYNGNDQLFGNGGNDRLFGGNDNDTLIGGQGGDVLDGQDGFDTASYATAAAGVYLVFGDNGNWTGDAVGDTLVSIERLVGSAFNDILGLSDGMDQVSGGAGNDQLYGLGGNDSLEGGLGGDFLNGGSGMDAATYANAASGIYLFIGDNGSWTGEAAGDSLIAIENLIGTNFDDVLGMDADNNIIDGLGGNDILYGQAGGDTLRGGTGFDTASYATATAGIYAFIGDWGSFTGDARGDFYDSIEAIIGTNFNDIIGMDDFANRLVGGAGDDVLYGEGGGDQLFGNDGFDTVSYAFAPTGVYVFLSDLGNATGDAAGDSFFSSIESIIGSAFDDLIGMGNFNDMLVGGGGNDILHGMGGGDRFFGNDGFDTVSYALAGSGIYVYFTDLGNATGDARGDSDFSSIESIVGTNFNDIIGMGDFADTIFGGAGNDILVGLGGNDTLWGGTGNDMFAYTNSAFGTDTIRDFQDGLDRIDFSRVAGVNYASLAISAVAGGVQVGLGSSSILISGATTGQISAVDFLFA